MKENVDLKPYTYFKIGGPARFFAEVSTLPELRKAVEFAHKESLPMFVMGAASNVLVADSGFPGVTIRMLFRDIERDGNILRVGAGVPNAVAVARAAKEGLAGIEWAVGIPGTVGGSIRGNAGCFGGEMKDVVSKVKIFNTKTSKLEEVDNLACEFGYRESMFKRAPHLIIFEVALRLREGDPAISQKLVRHYTAKRGGEQDIGFSSAGCLFKNVPWPADEQIRARILRLHPALRDFASQPVIPAGFLIDHLGLKGTTLGKISISKKHGNYVLNNGNARAEEVVMLAGLIKEYVHRKFGLHLQEEIQYVGFGGAHEKISTS